MKLRPLSSRLRAPRKIWLEDELAHVSLDSRDSSLQATTSSALDAELAQRQSDLPSTLERLHQLVRLLAGKQLVLLFDYDGCASDVAAAAPTRPKRGTRRRSPAMFAAPL